MSLRRLFRTVRHLRPTQLRHQLRRRIWPVHFQAATHAVALRQSFRPWSHTPSRAPQLIAPTTLRIFHHDYEIGSDGDWQRSDWPSLVTYNLHYFDDLVASDATNRAAWHSALMNHWIASNPSGEGPGWDAYTISRRIVNWFKYHLTVRSLDSNQLRSLLDQAHHLSRTVEWHLLGNHVLANGKALVFAGCFFADSIGDRWLSSGLAILDREMDEQILADGGHFERSPMYHAVVLEDLLDLVQLFRCYDREPPTRWTDAIESMLVWLEHMTHPDGQIALFNDAAFNASATPSELARYANHLGFRMPRVARGHTIHLCHSGFSRFDRGPVTLFCDVGPIGPDYIPGHAHADSLGFELSMGHDRVCVDRGTSEYEPGPVRSAERGTSGHNALSIDGADSSEVWAAFRVAQRARTCVIQRSDDCLVAEHDGFCRLRGGGVHRRSWQINDTSLHISDDVKGHGEHFVEVFLHLHPDVTITPIHDRCFEIRTRSGHRLVFEGDQQLAFQLAQGWYAPEFGKRIPNQTIIGSCRGELPAHFNWSLSWDTS